MTTESEKQPEKSRGLWIPYHILNIPKAKLGYGEKMINAHIYSFGRKGCWEGNDTLGEMFFVTGRTISTWIANLKKAGCIFWVHPKGRYRTIWAKSHPDVKTATTLLYMGEEISKEAVAKGHAAEILLRRHLRGGIEETFLPTTKDDCNQVGRNLLHTNNTTYKDISREATATPSPLPAGGQAPALLNDRKDEMVAQLEQQKKSIGLGARRRTAELTPAEREQRKQTQLMALRVCQPNQTGVMVDGE